jgi:hypothetical protein
MKTLNNLRFEILETINQYSDDSQLDYRLIDEFIINKRVKWFENTYNKFNKTVPNVYYQSLNCVSVKLVDQSECCDISTDCLILRTEERLPSFLSLSDGELLDKVSAVGIINFSFNIIPYKRAEFYGNGRYNTNSIGVFLLNGYLYLISKDKIKYPLLEKINIRGVFRDPRDASKFINCDNQPCWNPNMEFPLEERLWSYCKEDILKSDLQIKLSIPEDNANDNQDNRIDPLPGGGMPSSKPSES